MYDSSNTNVVGHAGRILSLTEGAMPYELSPELDTIGRTDFGGPLPTGFTAHPKIDPVTGEMHGFAYSWADPNLIYHVIDATGRLVRSEPITVGGPTMIHDFALTRTHVVFFDLPVVFDLDDGRAGPGDAVPLGRRLSARASASCRATAATPTSCGSMSSPATCSTR